MGEYGRIIGGKLNGEENNRRKMSTVPGCPQFRVLLYCFIYCRTGKFHEYTRFATGNFREFLVRGVSILGR